ncbi:immunoglobulin-like domain-containing protein [Anaerostipes hominis (ex Lee et al. 2021)]|uniref:immunoglobulin-like domain-containing protein n=1 Tax=Anaerostipes hominis (ex Lee et al. 2021) TaxID=2025494 RepID=UPI0022E6EB9D|nr:immunoglobulin-like domain-containing protein [Anaerostipes hominis (ex Lee et al. 2021)]
MKVKKFLCILMALAVMFAPIKLVYAETEEIKVFYVSDGKELAEAINEINNGDDAEYVIELLNDIPVEQRVHDNHNSLLHFEKGTTTIYGNGFTLTSSFNSDIVLFASDSAVVNLGSANEPEKSKLFFNDTDSKSTHCNLMHIDGNAIVNMYAGVVFQNNSQIGRFGGAISVGELDSECNAVLNMYGGEIRNCKDKYLGYGGAVVVGLNSTFNMFDGIIENNESYYGGGVCNVGTFNMYGGVIQNNTAQKVADDIYSEGNINIAVTANATNGFGNLASTGKQIQGWFEDGNNDNVTRWDVNNYCVEVTAEQASKADVVALKAAHSAKVTVTFDTNEGIWNDTSGNFIENAPTIYSQNLDPNSKADTPVSPTKTGYTFGGWFDEKDVLFDFGSEVTADVKLYAKWLKNMEPLNAIPTINASDKTLTVGDTFNPLEGVTASDKEDGDITKDVEVLSSDVDTTKAGTYTVTYKVTDSKGASSTKTIKVTVKGKDTPVVPIEPEKPNNPDTNKPENTESVETGDKTNLGLYTSLFVMSGLGIAIIAVLKKKKVLENR